MAQTLSGSVAQFSILSQGCSYSISLVFNLIYCWGISIKSPLPHCTNVLTPCRNALLPQRPGDSRSLLGNVLWCDYVKYILSNSSIFEYAKRKPCSSNQVVQRVMCHVVFTDRGM